MFCPKCGTQNPENGKFCRSCGTDLGNVSAALTGTPPEQFTDAGAAHIHHEARRRQDPNEVFGDAMRSIILGIGFLVVAIVLLLTNVAGGWGWWWAMLFPAFGLLARGIPEYMKFKRMEKARVGFSGQTQNVLNQSSVNADLPLRQTEYVAPPSVIEDTTRHLEMNSEGKTMTLPKSKEK